MTDDRGVAILGCGLFAVVLGVPDGALGVLWPSMRHSFGRALGDLGVLVLVGAVFYVATSAVTGWVVARIGIPSLVVIAAALAAGAFTGWALVSVWSFLLVLVGLLGAARGWVDSGMNAYAAHVGSVGRLGVLHAMYGIGATVGPLLVTGALALGLGWRPVVSVLAVGATALALVAVRLRHSWLSFADRAEHVAVDADREARGVQTTRRRVALPATLTVFFCYTAVEGATGAWAFVFLTEGRGLGTLAAGVAVAGYWAALTGGRLLLGAAGRRWGSVAILRSSCAIAVVGLGLVWSVPGGFAAVGLPITGFGFAAVFPVLVAVTPARVGRSEASKTIGLSVAAAALGGPALTALIGAIVGEYGVHTIASVLVLASAVLVAAELVLDRVAPARL